MIRATGNCACSRVMRAVRTPCVSTLGTGTRLAPRLVQTRMFRRALRAAAYRRVLCDDAIDGDGSRRFVGLRDEWRGDCAGAQASGVGESLAEEVRNGDGVRRQDDAHRQEGAHCGDSEQSRRRGPPAWPATSGCVSSSTRPSARRSAPEAFSACSRLSHGIRSARPEHNGEESVGRVLLGAGTRAPFPALHLRGSRTGGRACQTGCRAVEPRDVLDGLFRLEGAHRVDEPSSGTHEVCGTVEEPTCRSACRDRSGSSTLQRMSGFRASVPRPEHGASTRTVSNLLANGACSEVGPNDADVPSLPIVATRRLSSRGTPRGWSSCSDDTTPRCPRGRRAAASFLRGRRRRRGRVQGPR